MPFGVHVGTEPRIPSQKAFPTKGNIRPQYRTIIHEKMETAEMIFAPVGASSPGPIILGGAKIAGKSILPSDWLNHATSKQVDIGSPGRGYGYQWWTNDDGSFQAVGIFGQCIFIDPQHQLVIATNANWPNATDTTLALGRSTFFKAVQVSIDSEK